MAKRTGYDRYLDFQYTLNTSAIPSSNFFTALFIAIARADRKNESLLAMSFPDEVDAHRIWTRGDGQEGLLMKVTAGTRGLDWLLEDMKRWKEEHSD